MTHSVILRWKSLGHLANFSQSVELNGIHILQSTPERAREVAERISQALGWVSIEEVDRWRKEGDMQEPQR